MAEESKSHVLDAPRVGVFWSTESLGLRERGAVGWVG
jgi:hypothetical protein